MLVQSTTINDQIMNWHLLQTKPNAHLVASEHLRRQGYEVFLPLVEKTSKKGGKFKNQTTPLFPSYLFFGTLLENVPWKSVNATRGVSKALTLDGTYRSINYSIIESLKSRCNDHDVIQKMDDLVSGDLAKIDKGPFAEFICIVDKIPDSQRAWVLINILQQKTKAEISLNYLSKVN